jgi:hypothetical protein
MKRCTAFLLMALLSVTLAPPTYAGRQGRTGQQSRSYRKAAKKGQKDTQRYSRQQQKAMKKSAKAQRKALKKAQRRRAW